MISKSQLKRANIRWLLVGYDLLIYMLVCAALLLLYSPLSMPSFWSNSLVGLACLMLSRFAFSVYRQIWRYGGIPSYMRMLASDAIAGLAFFILNRVLPLGVIAFPRSVALFCTDLLLSISIRMIYRYIYQVSGKNSRAIRIACKIIHCASGVTLNSQSTDDGSSFTLPKTKVAIVGAGAAGVGLVQELLNNPRAQQEPACFIDVDQDKIGREIYGYPVLSEQTATPEYLNSLGVKEIIFTVPQLPLEDKQKLYLHYKQTGCPIKVYDFPVLQNAGDRRQLRDFDIEELLFRKPVDFLDDETQAYYRDKVVLITGGGGSIGSELCRQIARMEPRQLIILDVYENGAYDIQQELKIAYGKKLDLRVEVLTVCDREALDRVFAFYRPQIVLHAAAHKHVPLMEHNCCEAVKNNVFGTLNVVEMAIKHKAQRFTMISTDKAVNPTNVMGATKRMCEMIVQSYSQSGVSTAFNATRFGNVLGSAGSVIPLFRRQIAQGGPVTLTDFRIVRYFMTIPEASQLVLQSGALSKNGELFVLDMGNPVKILTLAENMIRLSGFEPYRDIAIEEIGLRPGEKLYEELLIKSEDLDSTSHAKIFVERDTPLTLETIHEKLTVLQNALNTGDNETVKAALMQVVPTFRNPEDVNPQAMKTEEMKLAESKV